MSLFRSKKMGYFSLIASHEYAWEILNQLGEINSLQFIDLNADETTFHRPYSNYIKRCEDVENKLDSIENYMQKFNQPVERCEDPKEFLTHLRDTVQSRNKAEWTYLDDIEAEVEEKNAALGEQISSYESLVENHNHLVEFKEVLLKAKPYVTGGGVGGIPGGGSRDIKLNYLAGVINKEDSLRFRRILFRITRGMTWTVLMDIEKPQHVDQPDEKEARNYFVESAKEVSKEKTVFLVVYQGGEHDMLKGKLTRICDSFGASKYGIPEDPSAFDKKLGEVEIQIKDAYDVLNVTRGHLQSVLQYFSDPRKENYTYSHIEGLRLFIAKEKALYHNLNMMKVQQSLIVGNCWCPLDRVKIVEDTLANLNKRKEGLGSCEFREANPPVGVSPPTGFDTNDFTNVFQEIVNTYGVPRYREINPGLFTIATFPFLFGVMFGDIVHGLLLLIAGLYLVFWHDKIEKDKQSLWHLLLPARYLLTMQGFFAFYCGLIYNDFTSVPFNLFGTCYDADGVKAAGCNYPLGIDPGWYHVSNELTFMNSFKMKLSIVLGVTQMVFGILLRGCNSVFSRKWLDFIFEFIPMLIFMCVTFGYMVVLIFIKWATPYPTQLAISRAPSIINIFIKMALSPGKWDQAVGTPLYGDADGNLQATVQLWLLVAALVCALLILIPKPLLLKHAHEQQVAKAKSSLKGSDYNLTENLIEQGTYEENQMLIEPQPEKQKDNLKKAEHGETGPAGEHFDMGEILVHQIIETIEFVLGSISNTASYLRLWALSLAHSQLAKVFFVNALTGPMRSGNFIVAFFAYWIFANITLAVLMLMDQMECFLHALRLHWVEFQNKFYRADGYAFLPLSFENILRPKKSGL